MATEALDFPHDDHNRKAPRCDSGRPLTPEQERFAQVLGRILAQRASSRSSSVLRRRFLCIGGRRLPRDRAG